MQEQNAQKRSFGEISSSDPVEMGIGGHDNAVDHSSSPSDASKFKPRKYQLKMFEVARERNTIAVLETGAGKTMIAVMLINDIAPSLKSDGDKKLIVFLAPTVHLVHQQYEVIKVHTSLEVNEYYGAKGVDEWNLKCWEKEVNQNDVLVMTPQILLDALRKAYLNIEMINFIIVDECHHATGNHPYTKIMKDFYHKSNNKPKIFGMTASPVIRKGVSSAKDCEGQISELESILDSHVFTIEDKTEVEVYVLSAKESCKFYDQSQFTCLDLKAKMEASLSKFNASLTKLQELVPRFYKDFEEKFKALRKQLSNHHAKIVYCLDELGIICAYEAVKVCLEKASNTTEGSTIYRESSLQCKYFLEDILSLISGSLLMGDESFLISVFDYSKAVELGYISPKLHELLQIFHAFGGTREVLCLIFVERIIAAKVVERFVKKVTCLSHFTVSYLTGSNTSTDSLAPRLQKETLELFRCGKVNLLFATDVVEEGIHVPNCSCVIRFDLPKTVRSYIQSRGRARQNNSQFIVMLERGNTKQRDKLFDIIRSERSMTDTAVNRDPNACLPKPHTSETMNVYTVHATGASVTEDSSVGLIKRYCEKLPGDKYYSPKPMFKYKYFDNLCECELTLPSNAAFQSIVSAARRNKTLAKQLVCLEACKKLHQMGALDDHLLPFVLPSQNNFVEKDKVSAPGAGTTKRKELHGTYPVRALSGGWGEKLNGVDLHAYRFDFSCNIITEIYSGFVLLIGSKLDDDVGNCELDLFLISKMIKATVSSCGLVHLDSDQITKAKRFQEFFFNGIFGKLFVKSKASKGSREFLLQNETKSLWSPSNIYLLLPLEPTTSEEPWRIDWKSIGGCVSVVEFLKRNACLDFKRCSGNGEKSSPCKASSSESEAEGKGVIHLANCSIDTKDLKGTVVVAIHTGRIYAIIESVSGTSSDSPFDGNSDGAPSEYSTFKDYFCKKYGIVLAYPEQSMLRLKHSHNAHNLLMKFFGEGVPSKASQHVHMPPELLVRIDIPTSVLKSLYLLPSLMHRLESLMLASQLREEINCHTANFNISISLILEALTTLRCCEKFSMERLELLGDSVLKYAVSCHLFLKYPEKNEGQLSSQRQCAICNSNLYKLGTNRKLQGYIRDSAFEPRRWVAPGQLSIHPVPCKCGVDTIEVPLDAKYFTEDAKVVVGKLCDMGHRWMGSKTISDCAEALIGAYYVGGGLVAALHMMKWLGLDAELEQSLVMEAITCASLQSYVPRTEEIKEIESKIGYEFKVKFLLQEAITHASAQEFYCYQRLEFLGDSVLDVLITWHLYQSHSDIDPGELTDLRSASVNNENFAQVAVRHEIHKYLQHSSTLLLSQIAEYVKSFTEATNDITSDSGTKGPKVLGDLVESIVGAVLIDSKLDLEEVWRIFKPLLSPIVTPDKLELPPHRELIELCDSLGYFIKEKCIQRGEMVHAEISLQLEDALLVGQGSDRHSKDAKGKAALRLLKQLEKRGISKGAPIIRAPGTDHLEDSSNVDSSPEPKNKKHKTSDTNESSIPAIEAINMNKGGPRTSLFLLCKKMLWPMPTFATTEYKSSTPVEFGEGPDKRTGYICFTSTITLHIPGFGNVKSTGDAKADKKSSFDSAALVMLYDLEKKGKIIIANS